MKYLHTMVRVTDLDQSLRFYCDALGLREIRRYDNEQGRYTLVFLAAPGDEQAQVELTYNWDPEQYGIGRAFGHLAYEVDDIYAACQRLMDHGVTINRPPRDGRMAFVRSPDNISVELIQEGTALPPQEPAVAACLQAWHPPLPPPAADQSPLWASSTRLPAPASRSRPGGRPPGARAGWGSRPGGSRSPGPG